MRGPCGPLLVATGVLDVLYVFVFHSRQLTAIAEDGFFNAVDPNVAYTAFGRETAFWHLVFGLMVLILGALVHWAQDRTGTLPAFLGWALLVLSVFAIVLMPVSGFWIVLPQAVMMILVARREGSGTAAKVGRTRRAVG